jgi:thiosulfate/3-mercaptopyruvate sulfurtransferase
MSIQTQSDRELVDSALIDASWINDHLDEFKRDDPDLRLLEVDRKPKRYNDGHIPGAIQINWEDEIGGDLGRSLMQKDAFEALMGDNGVTEDTSLVLYGDEGNWVASHAFWVCRYFDHQEVRMMSGGRRHWRRAGYDMTTETPEVSAVPYSASEPNTKIEKYVERSCP